MKRISLSHIDPFFLAIIGWLIIMLIPAIAMAQATISGNISGVKTGATVIVGNNIWLESGQSGQDIIHSNKGSKGVIAAKARTDAKGNYSINVASGSYIIIVWANGFTPESDTVNAPGSFSTVLLPTQRSSLHSSLTFDSNVSIVASTNTNPVNNPNPATEPSNKPTNSSSIESKRNLPTQNPVQAKGVWKRVATEIYLEEKKIKTLPIGQMITSGSNPNNGYIFSGGESNLTRTDFYQGNPTNRKITYHWTPPPTEIVPKQEYSISCESIGNAGNGVLISPIVDYNQSSGSGIIASYRDGKKVGKLVAQEAGSITRGKIVAGLSSGTVVGVLEYWYIYEWQTGATTQNNEPKGQLVNLALHKACKQSSTYFGTGVDQGANCGVDGRIEPDQDPRYMFHTNIENNPWWQVDLGKSFILNKIRLHNRINSAERAKFIQVFISQDGNNWKKVYSHNGSVWNKLDIDVSNEEARFVRLQLADRNYLHLFEVEVFGYN